MKNSILNLLLVAIVISGCASSAATSVNRVSTSTQTDLSGRWNDTDAKMVAEEMISNVLTHPWLTNFQDDEGRNPVLILGKVQNKSMEHIDAGVITKEIEREFIMSGEVDIVADRREREQIRDERMKQQDYASFETMKNLAQELGADFMMIGSISSIMDRNSSGKKTSVFYKVNLEIIEVETNRKVWLDTKEIKKLVERKRYN